MILNVELLAKIESAKDEVIAAGNYLGRRQYHVGLAGNISARVAEDLLICTRHGADKEALRPDDLVLCDLNGRKLDGAGEPTSELNIKKVAVLTLQLCPTHSLPENVQHIHQELLWTILGDSFGGAPNPLLVRDKLRVGAKPGVNRISDHAPNFILC